MEASGGGQLAVSWLTGSLPQEHGCHRCVWQAMALEELREGPGLRSCVRGEITLSVLSSRGVL